ncbi:MAG: DUF3562 domain-containing protein [Betaproteobacteria bacterium]|nr:DUF3562 domain-containing protein [Betaproteobacteria bacterium]
MYGERSKLFHQRHAIELLARESRVSIDGVTRLYETELAKLAVGARIRGFLPIFAMRKVREMLRQRGSGNEFLAADRRSIEWKGLVAGSARGVRANARLLSHRGSPAIVPQLNRPGGFFH